MIRDVQKRDAEAILSIYNHYIRNSALYTALMDRLANLSYHTVIGGIALPNSASVALHEKVGFEKIAHFREVGWKMDRWVDMGYWELIITNH
jgi:L-amino acid N-acyltransferase YncA